ncbi:hypothetical protein BC937DRAFT_90365 [Endogone sp. FLAS-F59071]|nr:hypothetical protein BC937DRAFT_90365 [Endogone sp. FLAS-F59071]|eukprot:RUS17147.1 hypothetical protein BC937DRAFT_90365 [Endogone sp. FLAS-F59071]
MLSDENEEALRERAALGNLKAVSHYLRSGVNINSANKMNGWTALHWASHRGHEDVVRTLLAHGADTALVTLKGQTAADLAKTDNVRALFGQRENVVPAEPELPFVAKYLREPDLDKLWSVPGEETGRAATPAVGVKKAAFEVAPAGQVAAPRPATGNQGATSIPIYPLRRNPPRLGLRRGGRYDPDNRGADQRGKAPRHLLPQTT